MTEKGKNGISIGGMRGRRWEIQEREGRFVGGQERRKEAGQTGGDEGT